MKPYRENPTYGRCAQGFTLVELLTVIAIIAVLAGILIPAVGAVQENARKASTRAELQGMAGALAQYHAEYRYWPAILRDGEAEDVGDDMADYVVALTGKTPDGGTPSDEQRSNQNRKLKNFYTFGDSLQEQGGSWVFLNQNNDSSLLVVVDHDGDGIIRTSQFPAAVRPEDDIRAKVALWSMDEGRNELYTATFDLD